MIAIDVLNWLNDFSGGAPNDTVDTLKAGCDSKETKKVAFCFIATPNVIKAAHEWGADVLITHEPTYYDHRDIFSENAVTLAKKKLIEETEMTVYRWHDHPHLAKPDVIHAGFIKNTGLVGMLNERDFILDEPMTALELARLIEEKLGVRHVRIVGKRDVKMTRLCLCLGACGGAVYDNFRDSDSEMMITGETSEWKNGYPIFDAAELGFNKAMLLLGHCGSERDGMMLATDIWNEAHPDIEGKYFECGELYTYTN